MIDIHSLVSFKELLPSARWYLGLGEAASRAHSEQSSYETSTPVNREIQGKQRQGRKIQANGRQSGLMETEAEKRSD